MDVRLISQIKYEEGGRSRAYRCPAGKLTIGYGHNLDANPEYEGKPIPHQIDEAFADALLIHDLERAERQLEEGWHGYMLMPPYVKDALVNMVFQMGLNGVLKFKKTLHRLVRCDWANAADEAMDSDWAQHDSPARAERVTGQIRTGKYYKVPDVEFK